MRQKNLLPPLFVIIYLVRRVLLSSFGLLLCPFFFSISCKLLRFFSLYIIQMNFGTEGVVMCIRWFVLGRFQGRFWLVLGSYFGSFLSRFRVVLGCFWVVFGSFLVLFWPLFSFNVKIWYKVKSYISKLFLLNIWFT